MQKFWIFAIALSLAGCNPPPSPVAQTAIASPVQSDRTPARVVSVGDGDTLRAIADGQEITVRLACIDAPESNQPLGTEATAYLRSLLPRDQAIALRIADRDRYGRAVAEVYRGETLVNLAMVREGAAVVYSQYLGSCQDNRNNYLKAESAAREERLGFWQDDRGVLPWDWRRGQRSPSPKSVQGAIAQPEAGNCDPAYPDVCIPPAPPDLSCGDISERRFAVRGSDPHGFDKDGDGIGCEG